MRLFTSEKTRKTLIVVVILAIYLVVGMAFVDMARAEEGQNQTQTLDQELDWAVFKSPAALGMKADAAGFGNRACSYVFPNDDYNHFELLFAMVVGDNFAKIQILTREIYDRHFDIPMTDEEYSEMVSDNSKAFIEGARPHLKELYKSAKANCR